MGRIGRRLAKDGVQVFLTGPSPLPGPWPVPVVATLHDLRKRRFVQTLRRIALLRAARVIVPSRFTRREAIRQLGLDESRITVIPNAADHLERPEPGPGAATGPLLAVGHLHPRKNLRVLVETVAILRHVNAERRLVLAGRDFQGEQSRLSVLAQRLGVSDLVEFTGEVEESGLAGMYAAACAVCVPSWHEGFGLAVAEAMYCGAPVIVSRGGALPEVAGPAAQVADGRRPLEWAAAVRRLEGAAERQAWIDQGRDRAGDWSWRRAASETAAVLQSAAVSGVGAEPMLDATHLAP
jgi:glycosyltransferase involved in cell wall biosynthesis